MLRCDSLGDIGMQHATAVHLSHLVRRGDAGSSAAFGVPPSAPRKSRTTPSTLEGLRRVKNEGPGAVSSKPSILVCNAWSSIVAACIQLSFCLYLKCDRLRQNALDAQLMAACKLAELFYRQLERVTDVKSVFYHMLSLIALSLLLTPANEGRSIGSRCCIK